MKAFKFFFWFFLAALLITTIPHVAYFFRAYEPLNDNFDLFWWIVSYALATGIDVTIYLLCTVIATSKRDRKDVSFVWVFIIFLTLMSYYMNYEHATQFQSIMLNHASQVSFPFIGNINSYIASCFPLMIVAFTWMSSKLNDTQSNSETLEQKAIRLESERNAKERIREATKGKTSGFINGLIDTVQDVRVHASTLVEKPVVTSETQPTTIDTSLYESMNAENLVAVSAPTNGHTSETPAFQELEYYVPKSKRK